MTAMPNPVSPVGERQEEDDDFDNRGMNSYDESFFANESNYNESFGTLSTTETNSKQQQEQPYNMSNIVVADDSEKTLDPDIDIAAEQIVNEFAEHVNRNQGQNGDMYVADNIYDSQTSSSHTGDYDEDGEPAVGVMSHSMAAGGFEELVTALDDGDHTDEPDEIFEEFDDDSYDEEEVTEEDDEEMEEELVDDADLDVIMEEAVNIMHTPDGTSAAANISPHSSDNEEEEEANDGEYLDNDRAGENEDTDKEQTPELQEKDIIMGGTLEQISPGVTMDEVPEEKAMPDETVGVEGDEDGAMMEFSESSRASNGAPLMGDALLGEMSEVSNMTSDQQQLGSSLLKNDKSERSTKSAATRQSASSRKSAASRQSASSKQSAASRQSASSKHIAASMQSANASSVKSNSERSNNSKAVIGAGVALGATATGIALASENLPDTQTAPVNPSVAAPLVEPRQQNVQLAQHEPRQPPPPQQQKQQEQQKQRPNRPSRDPSGLSLAPGVDGNVQTAAKQSPDTAKTKEMDVKKEEAVKEVKDIAVPVTPTVPELKDLEAGTSPNEATKEESPFVVAKNNEPAESKRSNRFLCLIALICLLVIVLIIVLSVLLPRNKDGASKELAPTMASPPLPSPTQSPANPTPSPGSLKPSPGTPVITSPPTMLSWVESIRPINGQVGSGFGTSVALDANILAVGAPLGQSNGAVYSSVNSGDGKWKLIPHLLGEQSGDSFGSAVDLRNGQMVIGAQSRPIVNTLTPAGAAYFYEYNSTQGVWLQIGSEMRSSEDILAANGEFGAAVALGLNTFPRVVIGAPKSNKDMATLETGRLYTFENKGTSWNSIDASPLFGNNAYDWFGASLDMTSDGSRFIAGAPGNGTGSSGYFQIYYNGDSQWNVDFELVGTPDEALGSSVAVLSDAGDIFAVGGPGFGNGAGRVMVYQRQSSLRRNLGSTANNYVQLGDFVVGELGDRLGSQGSLSGGVFEDKLLLVIGTASGDVKTYSFNNFTNLWKLQFETLATGGNETAVIDYDSAADDVVTGFGNQDQVALYSRVAVSTSSTPTSSSTPRPASAPVASPTPALAPVAASGPPTTQTPLATPLATPPPPPSATSLATKAPTMTAVATNAPSMLPGMVNTPVPVNATTTAPSSTGLSSGSWILKGSSFTPIALSSGFGSSLSLASSTLAIGAPLTLGNGAVFIYRKVSGVWQTAASGQLFGSVNGGQFGAAVDVTDTFLIVGAPTVLANGTATQTGAAYCYIYSGQWTSLGGTLLGDTTVYGTNEQFGSAVAASTTARVVVGAPGSSAGLVKTRGRVYVFEFNATSSAWDLMQDELGTVADVALGSSVDISSDGNQFIVGAPGGNGYAELYTYNGSAWVSTFMSQGGSNEAYGSSVVLLSPTNNNIFAVGAPGYLNGQGRVVVYQKSGSGSFVQMGPDIVGVAGDRLGDVNKLSGGGVTPTVIVGTAQGSVKRFDYDSATNTWVQKGATVDTGFGGNLTAVAAASQSQTFAVGGNLDASLYALS